jgi:hypothetical protein
MRVFNFGLVLFLILGLCFSFIQPAEAVQDAQFYIGGSLYAPGQEIVEMRTENSKTTYLGKIGSRDKFSVEISSGAIHYKDNYYSNELWKDIDLTIVNGRVDKAPYILVVDGAKVTMTDKRTGSVTVLELTDTGSNKLAKPILSTSIGKAEKENIDIDTDLEITWENTRVRVTRVLKSDKAPKEAKFNISQTGNGIKLGIKAEDSNSKSITVVSSIKSGVLSESVDSKSCTYPLRVDPTLDILVGASADDCWVYYGLGGAIDLTSTSNSFGHAGITGANDAGMRFLGVTIAAGATITTAYVEFTANSSQSNDNVALKVSAEQNNNAATFSTLVNYSARTLTTAQIDWDFTTNWLAESTYQTLESKTIIQELVNDYGGLSNANIVIFVRDDGSTASAYRSAYSYDSSTTKCPKLHIEYTSAPSDPTIATVAASDIFSTAAQLNSNVTFDGNDPCTVTYAYIISTSPHASYADCAAGTEIAVAGTWTTGQNAFLGIAGLTAGATYYYSVKIVNSTAVPAYGAVMSFSTSSGIFIPTNFTAITSGTSISLSWTKGVGAQNTVVRYSPATYPVTINDGQVAYLLTGSSCQVTGLTPGTTYYFSAWGKTALLYSGTAPLYANGKITVLATTLAYDSGSSSTTTLVTPTPDSTWTQTPSANKTSTIPLFGSAIQGVAVAYNQPVNYVWYFAWILAAVGAAIVIYIKGNFNFVLSLSAMIGIIGVGVFWYNVVAGLIVVALAVIGIGWALVGFRRPGT